MSADVFSSLNIFFGYRDMEEKDCWRTQLYHKAL